MNDKNNKPKLDKNSWEIKKMQRATGSLYDGISLTLESNHDLAIGWNRSATVNTKPHQYPWNKQPRQFTTSQKAWHNENKQLELSTIVRIKRQREWK